MISERSLAPYTVTSGLVARFPYTGFIGGQEQEADRTVEAGKCGRPWRKTGNELQW